MLFGIIIPIYNVMKSLVSPVGFPGSAYARLNAGQKKARDKSVASMSLILGFRVLCPKLGVPMDAPKSNG